MIHIFRKMRRQFLGDDRFKKYILYAAGEIILVVIGILLALQFNDWNISKENKVKEEWYLNNIAEDIEYQTSDLQDLKESYEENIAIAKQILREYAQTKTFTTIDSLNYKLNILMRAENFPNINNTYQELVSSGQQNLISDKELSIDIIDYYLFCDDNDIDFKNNNDNVFYIQINPTFYSLSQVKLFELELEDEELELLENITVSNALIKEKLEKRENVLSLLNSLKLSILMNASHLEMVVETLEEGKKLTSKIDNYLGYEFIEDPETN